MNELSHIIDVNSGVPQSSHLASLLFKLFIIDSGIPIDYHLIDADLN